MYIRAFFNWLNPPLRPLERKILSAVQAKLSLPLAKLFGAQVDRINYVQRREGGCEVGLYVISKGRVARDRSLSLPTAIREWPLARVRVAEGGAEWIATVHAIDGHLSSIEYDATPPRDGETEVSLHVELLDPPSRGSQSEVVAPTLPEWLQPYVNRFGVANIDPPLTPESRAAILARFESELPSDYADFVTKCDGVQIGALSLVGLSEAYETRALGHEYIVLGQVNGRGTLAVRKPGPALAFMDYEDGSITDLGPSLQTGIERVMKDINW